MRVLPLKSKSTSTAAERYGIAPGDVRRTAATLLSGLTVGNLFEQQKVFDVVVWSTPDTRASLTAIQDLAIDAADGGQVRLADVADVRIAPNLRSSTANRSPATSTSRPTSMAGRWA